MPTHTPESIFRITHEREVRFINLQFTDIVGSVKSITLPVSQLERVLNQGVWFDGSSIEGFARISESDMYLFPDLDTFAVLPWTAGVHATARFICNVYTPDGEPFMGSPRTALINALEEVKEMGLDFRVGPELEFFLFETDAAGAPIPGATHDKASYFDATADRASLVRQDMITALEAFGIEVEASHHEGAHGQHEIDFHYSHALAAADHAVTFKYALKAVARQHGLYATFMPKPLRGAFGSGMHVHQSFSDLETGQNVFADADDPHGLSKMAKHYIAGQMKHARAMTAILAPLVNSYKRLVPGYEAPVYVSWARINRSALIRVPRPAASESTRLELRCPDPSCNPYLAFTVMLKCGLDGVKNELPVPDATEEDLFESSMARHGLETLPGSLNEALDEMEQDDVVRQALGPHIYERFVDAKRLEWDEYRMEVTPWELDRYLYTF